MSWRRRDSTSRLYELPVGILPGDLVAPELEQVAAAYLDPLLHRPLEATAGGRRQAERVQHQLPGTLVRLIR